MNQLKQVVKEAVDKKNENARLKARMSSRITRVIDIEHFPTVLSLDDIFTNGVQLYAQQLLESETPKPAICL